MLFLGSRRKGRSSFPRRFGGRPTCEILISIVNLGGVLYVTEGERGLHRAHEVLARVDELPIEMVDVDRRQALVAAHMKAPFPIALADCLCAALAVVREATVVTGDPEFRVLEEASIVSLHWLGDD